ncbi:replication fork protection component Swi3-domain-containing protein [Apiosordaria backusii]|uniref:Chromosome segregation in meiosis protein n=1 Tax=Apiosordaria backusii TaxID=314023 RepID=A0AA40A0P7_9PEZI|nr:replication fork protection component Swi3-domain-containing protein [Apiosordaria backusii]
MPAPATTSKATNGNKKDSSTFVDDFLEGWSDFDEDDPFGSPKGDKSKKTDDKKNNSNSKKRKGTDVLGLDTEVDQKKARVPRVKLDDTRLLSEKGIPWLRKNAETKLKLKGKGHEFSDAARMLSFYQEWLDELFPKASFLDALAMVEKAGHKTSLKNARMKWIDELKPRAEGEEGPPEEDAFPIYEHDKTPKDSGRIAPVFDKAKERQKTPDGNENLFADDIYNATPRAATNGARSGDVPDDDDLDALMAEAEANSAPTSRSIFGNGSGSIFGNGTNNSTTAAPTKPQANDIPDDDDLDALMAEAEADTALSKPSQPAKSIFGDGKPKEPVPPRKQVDDFDDDDLDALMAEVDAQPRAQPASAPKSTAPAKAVDNGDEDDLDALMAEAEAEGASSKPDPAPAKPKESGPRKETNFDDDEEAIAEMDGLW